jgi:hypothetical protein
MDSRVSRKFEAMILALLTIITILLLVIIYLGWSGIQYLVRNGTRLRYIQNRYREDLAVAYHVTYLAMKDHDARNAGVPMQERLVSGQQFIFGSQLVWLQDDDRCRYVPAMLKDLILRKLDDPDISWLEFLNIHGMNKREMDLNSQYLSDRQQFLVQQQGPT